MKKILPGSCQTGNESDVGVGYGSDGRNFICLK
jgi:hypothetical protein